MRARRLRAVCVLVAIAGMATSGRSDAAQDSGITWLIFVDDLHLDFRNTGNIRTLLRSIASDLVRDGDAFALRSSGSSPAIPLTTDRSRLEAVIGEVAGNALPADAMVRSSIRDELHDRASVAQSAAIEMLRTDPSQPRRRRAMLYVSNGYQLDIVAVRFADVAGAAQRSNVAVFALNAGALPGAPTAPVQGDAALWDSLRAIAEPTGGFAVLVDAEFGDALQRISRRLRD